MRTKLTSLVRNENGKHKKSRSDRVTESEDAGITVMTNMKYANNVLTDAQLISDPYKRFLVLRDVEESVNIALNNVGGMGNTTAVVKNNLYRVLTGIREVARSEIDLLANHVIKEAFENTRGIMSNAELEEFRSHTFTENSWKHLKERTSRKKLETILWFSVGIALSAASVVDVIYVFIDPAYRELLVPLAGVIGVPLGVERIRKGIDERRKWKAEEKASEWIQLRNIEISSELRP